MTPEDESAEGKRESIPKTDVPVSRDFKVVSRVIVPLIRDGKISLSEAGLAPVMLVEEAFLSINELVRLSHQSRPTVLEQLRALQSEGIIEHFNHGNEVQYRLATAIRLYRLEKRLTSGALYSSSLSSISSTLRKIIEDLNKVSGKHFRWDNLDTQLKIKARLKDGYSFQDFQKVHRNKLSWLLDPKMMRYYRPETLYRQSKFDGYLDESTTPRNESQDIQGLKLRYRARVESLERKLRQDLITQEDFDSLKQKAREHIQKLIREASR